jgi:hypothetical protein
VTRISTRYAPALLGLLVLAAAASAAQAFFPRWVDPCRNPEALRVTSLIPGTVAEGEILEKRGKVVIQWSEGRLEPGPTPGPPLRFQIVRSFGSLLLYLQPLTLLGGEPEAQDLEVRTLDTAAGPLDVHLESARVPERVAFVAYFYTHGNEAVSHPFFSKLRSAIAEMLWGTWPLGLFAVTGQAADLGQARERAEAWLVSAFEHFDAACRDAQAAAASEPSAG